MEFKHQLPKVYFFRNYDWREVLFMRFGTYIMHFNQPMVKLLKWDDLAQMFKQPLKSLRAYCNQALKIVQKESKKDSIDLRFTSEILKTRRKVVPLIVQRLVTSQNLLQVQSHLGVDQRCSDIYRRFKIEIKPHRLRWVYRQKKITIKKVMLKAPLTPPHLFKRRETECINLKAGLKLCDQEQIPIYYLDECSFTSKDF